MSDLKHLWNKFVYREKCEMLNQRTQIEIKVAQYWLSVSHWSLFLGLVRVSLAGSPENLCPSTAWHEPKSMSSWEVQCLWKHCLIRWASFCTLHSQALMPSMDHFPSTACSRSIPFNAHEEQNPSSCYYFLLSKFIKTLYINS